MAVWLACGVASARAAAIVRTDSVGIYSEELEGSAWKDAATGMVQAGVGIVRQPFYWSRIETSPGKLDYTVYDHVVAAAAKAGLSLLPVIMNPPTWRTAAPARGASRGMYPPTNPGDMGLLAGALAHRYGPGGSFWTLHKELKPVPIHSWQVWNEPNISAFWATGPNPAAYTALVQAVSTAIHAVDPTAEIVAAGLPPFTGGYSIPAFLDGMYAAGARGYFDTIAIHPYAPTPDGVLSVLQQARDELNKLGDPDRPLWATEFGWATGGPRTTVTVTEAQQATVMHDTLSLLQANRDALGLRGYIMFRWRDVPLNSGQADLWPLHTGLLRKDGSAKPAAAAFRDAATSWLVGAVPAQSTTAHKTTTPSVGVQRVTGAHRKLVIHRRVARGRLIIDVDTTASGHNVPVRIGFTAVRRGHVVARAARKVAIVGGVAHVSFKLSKRARSAPSLRITAAQMSVKATSVLRRTRTTK